MKLTFLLVILVHLGYAQNVGIGVANPAQKLDVNGNLQFSGAIMPNGDAGTAGLQLTSNGAGNPPVWRSSTEGQQFRTVYSTAAISLPASSPNTLIPGLSQTIHVPQADTGVYDVYIYVDGAAQLQNFINANIGGQLEISIWINGVAARYVTTQVDNIGNLGGGIRAVTTSLYTTLPPGDHLIEVFARNRGGGITINVGAPNVVGNYLICSMSAGLIKR